MAEMLPHGGQMVTMSCGRLRIDIDRRTAFNIINNLDDGLTHLQLCATPLIFCKCGAGVQYDIQPKAPGTIGVCVAVANAASEALPPILIRGSGWSV